MKQTARIAVVLSHPTQYYSPWFRWVRANTGLEIRVFYLWDFGVTKQRDPKFETSFAWDVDLLSGYESEFVPNTAKNPSAEHFLGFINPGLTGRIAAWRPDAMLLFGYKWASHMSVIVWARVHKIPILFRGDSHLIGRESPAPLAKAALGILFSQFDGFLYAGEANRDYFRAFGVPDRKLFRAPHSVNGELFDPSEPRHATDALRLRSQMLLDASTKVVLFAGKLVPEKQPRELLECMLSLSVANAALVFVGDGPEKDALVAMAAGGDAQSRSVQIRFLPFANQSEMPSRYLLADVFALPSRGAYETWGLAVNEAMQMGVPCLVSDRVGSQRDLVTPGVTGWVFKADDPLSLRQALGHALSDVEATGRREELRKAVRRRIEGYTYAETTEGLLAAIGSLRTRKL